MSNGTRKLARREQTQAELRNLHDDITAWLKHRRSQDPMGQYKTQLDSLESLLVDALVAIENQAKNISTAQALGEMFEECELYDIRCLWVRRVWHYFRTKFDQRDDPLIGPVLRAADEVIWSCYHPVFATAGNLGLQVSQGPVPLPFIDTLYSPFAYPAELVPGDLQSDVDATFVADHLQELPVPLLHLPPMCARSPWWLVYVGHEAGHFVQYHLLQDLELVGAFRSEFRKTVAKHSTDPDAPNRWGRWSQEVFADVFSVACMGQWAVDAMAELDVKKDEDMAKSRDTYPAPAIRLKLLSLVATELGLPLSPALTGLGLDQIIANHPDLPTDAALLPRVVDFCLGPLPVLNAGLRSLTELNTDDFLAGGTVYQWKNQLVAAGNAWHPPIVTRNRRNARLFASASLAAWRDAISDTVGSTSPSTPPGGGSNLNLDAPRASLAQRALQAIDAGRELGTRAGWGPAAPKDAGARFAELLLNSNRERLAGGVRI
jgi:hypothetical protein